MDEIPLSPERHDTELRLINWGRWCNSGRSVHHCGSIEWQWQSRWKEAYGFADIGGDAPRILDRIDALDAQRVQAIMQSLPLTYRHVLAMKYVKRENPKRIAYKANCREWQLDGLLIEILDTVQKCLT